MLISEKLKTGDEIRVVAPSRSLSIINEETRTYAKKQFDKLGLKISFSKNCEVSDEFLSSTVEQRVEDLHEAFLDKNIKAIFTVIGGFNVNQILGSLDYNLIKNNPKIICGYSDTTALTNAIYHKTGMITYSGPSYSTLGMKKGIDYSVEYIKKCFFKTEAYSVVNPKQWSDDLWFLDQENRTFYADEGIKVLQPGQCKGKLIGGNLCTFNLLQGTDFMPSLFDTILFLEDDDITFPEIIDRDLQSLIHQKGFDKVRGIVFGKFQIKSNMTDNLLEKIIKSKPELKNLPVLYNVSFGHTTPHITFPIGGYVEIDTGLEDKIFITQH